MTAQLAASAPGPVSAERLGTATLDLAWLLIAALVVRLATFNGIFGSDDTVYFARAVDVATGQWSTANYNGALRYGFNIPAGFFVWLFGPTPFVVNLWPLLCSLVEIGAVYLLANSVAGRRAGVIAALLLASAPLHIAVATRLHADPVVSMFITLSFVLLWYGWRRGDRRLLFCCGLAIGGIFWTKELVAVTWLAFLPLLWLFRRRWADVLPVLAGVVLMLVLHGVLMTVIAGNPLHLVKTVLGQVQSSFIEGGQGEDSPGYYLRYLFVDLRHIGLIGIAAVFGTFWVLRQPAAEGTDRHVGSRFVLAWFAGLFVVLSFFPVSLSPLRFAMKQSNYLTLFMAPLAILSGFALAAMAARWRVAGAVACAFVGLLLGLLQQADYRAFTANSKALSEWAVQHPNARIAASTNNSVVADFWADLHHHGKPRAEIVAFRRLPAPDTGTTSSERSRDSYALLDTQTALWFAGPSPVTAPPPCWQLLQRLEPLDLGLGNTVAAWVAGALRGASRMGVPAAGRASSAVERLATPKPADLYRVNGADPLCRRG